MSPPEIQSVRLELVRPGPPHNQLLSPLTPYMALCGEGSPVTFHIGLEHHQLLTRLERLRYRTKNRNNAFVDVPDRLREAEIDELGDQMARIFAHISTLSTALAQAQGNGSRSAHDAETIVQLRIVLSGSELSYLPFELAIAPQAFPGEGLEFCLQQSLPIVVTREAHRDRPRAPRWNPNVAPKILFIYAQPSNMSVPFQGHVQALLDAVDPWTKRVVKQPGDTAEDVRKRRLPFIKERLRILPNASIAEIERACGEESFTHVHILAHGDVYKEAGVDRFGIALCDGTPSREKTVVSGERLAQALLAGSVDGNRRWRPAVVSLMTCDSGNQSDVLVPGGSIAHDLHAYGIPWVFASQFPLMKSGSIKIAHMIYPRLLRGDDPRHVLFETRRHLYVNKQNDHDWGSLVAYSTALDDFEGQVADFFAKQMHRAIEVQLGYADDLINQHTGGWSAGANRRVEDPGFEPEIEAVTKKVECLLDLWRSRLPEGDSPENRLRRVEAIGIHGSTYKRIAIMWELANKDQHDITAWYDKSIEYYTKAMKDAVSTAEKFYWTATNYLSLNAVKERRKDASTFSLAMELARRDLESTDPSNRAWAHATLAELEMLSAYHSRGRGKRNVEEEVLRHCRMVVELAPETFHVESTRRQFQRYVDFWKNDAWKSIAAKAVQELTPTKPKANLT